PPWPGKSRSENTGQTLQLLSVSNSSFQKRSVIRILFKLGILIYGILRDGHPVIFGRIKPDGAATGFNTLVNQGTARFGDLHGMERFIEYLFRDRPAPRFAYPFPLKSQFDSPFPSDAPAHALLVQSLRQGR